MLGTVLACKHVPPLQYGLADITPFWLILPPQIINTRGVFSIKGCLIFRKGCCER